MRQGLKRSHVFATCLACSLADVSLIAAGILGVGALVSSIEGAEPLIAMGAAAFPYGRGPRMVDIELGTNASENKAVKKRLSGFALMVM